MPAFLATEGRFLNFDRGDWALLLGGFALVILVPFLS